MEPSPRKFAAVTASRNCLCLGPQSAARCVQRATSTSWWSSNQGHGSVSFKFESLVEELESLAGRKVDLVTKRGLKPWVRPKVLKDARVIYAA